MKYDAVVDEGRGYSPAQIWNNILGTFQTGGHRVGDGGMCIKPEVALVISYDIEIPGERLQEFHARTGILLKPRA